MKTNVLTTASQILFAFLFAAVGAFSQEPQDETSLQYNRLSKQEQSIILRKGTEARFSGKYNDHKADGTYICRRCNAPLFDSTHKFENSCGWPCFDDAMQDAVRRSIDGPKKEILCTNCGGHLGHAFDGEGFTPKNVRNCVNSVSLTFVAEGIDCPGVIMAKEKGSREKLDANKNALLQLALASAKVNALRYGPSPKSSSELLRNKLLEQLKDGNHDVVESALSKLEYGYVRIEKVNYISDREDAIGIKLSVKERLIELLDSAFVDTRELAARRLGELGPLAEDALPKLRELLANSDSRTKLEVAEAVWRISGDAVESANALVKLIREDEEFGQSTTWRFEWMGPAAFTAFKPIEGLSKDPRDKVRETATKILGTFGPKYSLATEASLIARLADTSPQVRIAASLGLLKSDVALEEAIETLVEVMAKSAENAPTATQEKQQEELLISAINAIGRFEGEAVEAVLPISIHLNSSDLNIRQAAAAALRKIGPGAEKAIPFLAKAMRDTETRAYALVHYVVNPGDDAARALGSIGMAAVPTLLDSLNDPEAVVRMRAARELGGIQESARQTVVPLMAKLSDSNADVRLETIRSLGRLGKDAIAAAPALTKFLFVADAFTSFPFGGGVGITVPMSSEALWALRSVEASEAQIVPVILDALARKENLTLQAVAVLRQYPNRSNAFEIPLRRLLGEKNLGAACALAALGANDSDIQVVLAENLIKDRQVNSVAALGIGQLVAHGVTLDEAIFAQLSVAACNNHVPLSIWTILLRLAPDDNAAVAEFMVAARNASPLFDPEIDWEEAESALVELIGHQSILDAMQKELENPDDLIQSQFLSARVLIAANQKRKQAFACIEKHCPLNGELPQFGRVAEFLFKLPPSEQTKSLLVKLLACNDAYVVHGCFSGNGSEKLIVGDRAALALVHHHEVSALSNQLGSDNAMVRLRAVRALGACGDLAITPKLVELAKDSEASVRKEVIRTLGKIGRVHPEMRNELRPVLEATIKDVRRSVSDEVFRMLRQWPNEN